MKFCFLFGRGRGIRTPIDGFGDHSSTIELFPYTNLIILSDFLIFVNKNHIVYI